MKTVREKDRYMKNHCKGQIQITLLGAMTAISFIAAPIIAYFSAQAATKTDISNVSERTARLETSVPLMQSDLRDIKTSLQAIEKSLRK